MRPKARQLDIVHLMTATNELVARIRVVSLVGFRSRTGGVGSCAAAVHSADGAISHFGGRQLTEGWVVFVDGGEKGMLDGQRGQGLVSDGHAGWGA